MSDPAHPGEREQRDAFRYAMMAGTARGLGLLKRVPELMRRRGWPEDVDLAAVLSGAVVCVALGVTITRFRRPKAADGCGGAWPQAKWFLTAQQIVDACDLGFMLERRD